LINTAGRLGGCKHGHRRRRLLAKTLYGMVIVGRRRRVLLLTSDTAIRTHGGDPVTAVLPANVNNEIRLHLACMGTAGAGPCRSSLCGVCLHPVLLKAALLNEGLSASRLCAKMGAIIGVHLHVIEHCILSFLCNTAVGADKFSLLVTNVCSHPEGVTGLAFGGSSFCKV